MDVKQAETDALVTELQRLLDAQADGLERSSGRLLAVSRRGIGVSMRRLCEIKRDVADEAKQQESDRRRWIEEQQEIRRECSAIMDLISKEQTESPEASKRAELLTKKSAIDREISELETRLHTLRREKAALKQEDGLLESTIESRCSPHLRQLRDLEHRQEPDSRLDITTRELDVYHEKYSSANREAEALQDGLVVWQDSTNIIGDVEAQLAAISSARQPDGPAQMVASLSAAIKSLQKNYDLSESNDWSLLSTAIGQELAALQQGLDFITSRDKSRSSQSPGLSPKPSLLGDQ